MIDDPVQSMDPARVDGLAQVLARTAKTHQVIVFTHGDRLPEATRRLGIDARIVEVTRREDSVVELRESLDPVLRNLDDARARAHEGTAQGGRAGGGAGLLSVGDRGGLHRRGACRIGRGEPHLAVERLLDSAAKTNALMALALWDDSGRAGDVMANVGKRWGEDVGDALGIAIRGAHAGYRGNLLDLVPDTATSSAAGSAR